MLSDMSGLVDFRYWLGMGEVVGWCRGGELLGCWLGMGDVEGEWSRRGELSRY